MASSSCLVNKRKIGPLTKNNVSEPTKRKRIDLPIDSSLSEGVDRLLCSFKNRIVSYRLTSSVKYIDYHEFFEEIKYKLFNIISEYLQEYHTLKIHVEVFACYVIPEKELTDIKSFITKNKVITMSTDLNEILESFLQEIVTQTSEFQEKDSGWALEKILFMDININKFSPLSASTYIKLPKTIEVKKAVLNIKNTDNACFAWSIMAAIFPARGDVNQSSSYPHYESVLNFDGLEFPIKLKDIKKFEKMNNISVNVFGIENTFSNGKCITEVVGPLHFTKQRQETHVNLLLISNNSGTNHYCLIKNMSRLVSSQKSKHNGSLQICDGCLQSFGRYDQLKLHQMNDCNHLCTRIPSTNLRVNRYGESTPENMLKFEHFEKQLPVPFVIYADFESILKPIDHNLPCEENSFTVKVCEHEPYSFAFYVKCYFNDQYSEYVTYRGPNAAKVFIEKLENVTKGLYNKHLKYPKRMIALTKQEEITYNNSRCCHICGSMFEENDVKVQDHCHLTGKFRGAAHSVCNLNYKVPKFIPVFFHCLSNYDSHLFIKEIAKNKEHLSIIAETKEKYISFSKSILVEKSLDRKKSDTFLKIRFVDSFRFLPKSLDKISQTLKSSECKETRKYYGKDEEFNLIRKKGVFPYNYVDSFEKLEETKLPCIEAFYNKLIDEPISVDDYERAAKVWATFKCKTLGEYADLYLKSDVLLLADIFENFRKVCLEQYKLDPAHYLTAPSLSWDAMLRYTKVQLELLTDLDAIHFFRKGIRGGVAQCSKRKSTANNKFLTSYDPSKETSYIMYLDATNLYGAAMKEYLPEGNFRWLTADEVQRFDNLDISETSPIGYVLEVDLEYPANLHNDHNDLPFCPEKVIPPKCKNSKLIPNLRNKDHYIIHYRNLKQCLKYGMLLKKIHRILEFSQSAWLASYIDLNTRLRNAGKGEFEKDLFKLMVNSIFGKTMENVDKRRNIKLCSSWESTKGCVGAKSLIALPYFKSCSIFGENLVAIHLDKLKVVYDKPLYVGFTILDISKTIIYDFLYGYLKPKYGDKATVLYTDTDSLIIEVFTENIYDDMKVNIDKFDTSNFKPDNIHNIPQTKSVVGNMKDEYAGSPIECFYGLRAKAYCLKASDNTVLKKAKGVSKSVITHHIDFNDYVQIVTHGGVIFRKMSIFKSNLHTIHTEIKNKIALSSLDDKRYILPDGINTLAWGHYKLDSEHVQTEEKLNDLVALFENFLEEEEECSQHWDFDLSLLN